MLQAMSAPTAKQEGCILALSTWERGWLERMCNELGQLPWNDDQ